MATKRSQFPPNTENRMVLAVGGEFVGDGRSGLARAAAAV
jgi:hypothetical protein